MSGSQELARSTERSGFALALACRAQASEEFGRRAGAQPFSLVVDLSSEPIGPRWLRGLAALALLCSTALLLAPGSDPFGSMAQAAPASGAGNLLIAHAQRQTADPAIQPVPAAVPADFVPAPARVASQGSAVRVSGQVSSGLYWSLRDAGVTPATAANYLRALSSRIDLGADIAPFDRFDLVFDKSGEKGPELLYAALHRAQGDDIRLVKWRLGGGKPGWFDADGKQRRSTGIMAPVPGRVTSGFGARVHPIFRFRRMHNGVDFGSPAGTPIVSAADGRVVAAGWAGGYGRQVRVAHGNGVVTSYSHMSGIAASPGMAIRQGQVIGYVGSSGVSTGPHLHFEVRVAGRPVDPLSVQLASRPALSGADLAQLKARVRQLTAIGTGQHGANTSS